MKPVACTLVVAVAGLTVVAAQQPPATMVWAPKPAALPEYVAPQKPHVKLADLRARHKQDADWRELIVDDGNSRGEYIQSAPGSKVATRFHPDTREWWAVMDGQIRFEIEGQQPFVATRGSVVQVAKQTLYSLETIGDRPSLRFEVGISNAKTLYAQAAQPPAMPGINWVHATYNRRPAAYGEGNQSHINMYEAAKGAGEKYNGGRVVRDDRMDANLIYGYEKNLPPLDPKDRGHFHPDSPEFWVIMTGQIRYAIEGLPVFIADEGDIAYAPSGRYHLARFAGPGPSCRLAIVRFPNNSALIER